MSAHGRSGTLRRGVALALCCVLALAGCALLGKAPEDRITIELSVGPTEAARRTLAAFRSQGYTVRETLTSGSEPETESFRQGDDAEAVFRAAVSGSGRQSRVVLTGTYRKRRLAGLVKGDEHPILDSDDELERQLWNRMLNLSLVIRRPR